MVEYNSNYPLPISELMLRILTRDPRFEKAMEDNQFRSLFNAFIIRIYSYSQDDDLNDLQALEKEFLNVYDNMEKYSKEYLK